MTDMNIDERRSEVRYPINDSSAVLLSPDNIISYALLDISESGLAFAYNGPGTEVRLKGHGKIDLFGDILAMDDMEVKIISDRMLTPDDAICEECVEVDSSNYYLRRCGVQFVNMSVDHIKVIVNYLNMVNL